MSTVSFSNDVEAAVPAATTSGDTDLRLRSSLTAAKANPSLSKSAKAWDLDGDGQLDEAELALKNMDSGGKGQLTKDDMYKLMNDNLNTKRDLFKMKKFVIG